MPTASGLVLNKDGTLSLEGCAEVAEPSKTAALARFLRRVLPPRSPAPLMLAVARAAGELTFPPFESTDAFIESIARFLDRDPRQVIAALHREFAPGGAKYDGIDEIRRARRASGIPLGVVARESGIPIYILRQLEWGDFRQWRNDEWSARATVAYARAAGLNPDGVIETVERERRAQLVAPVMPVDVPNRDRTETSDPVDLPLVRTAVAVPAAVAPARAVKRRALWRWPLLATAATVVLVASGGSIIEQLERWPSKAVPAATATRPVTPSQELAAPEPAAPERAAPERVTPLPQVASVPPSTAWHVPRPKTPTRLVRATAGDEPSFSPSFSSAGSAMFFQRGEPDARSALVRADRDSFTGDLRVMRIVDDGARNYHARPSPDGQLIAFDSDRDGERGVYVASSSGADVHRVSGPGFAAIPSWSPDGARLAFVREGRSPRVWDLWLLDLRSNEMRQLTDFAYGQAWGASWFPDGRRIAYSHEDQLIITDLESGTHRTFRSPTRGALLRTPSVSPDGRHIAFQVFHDGAWLLDLKDGSMRRILEDPTAEEFAWDAAGRRLAFHSRRSGTWSIWIMAPDGD